MPLHRCPICDKSFTTAAESLLPFCSERCKQVDLGRWLGEAYGLPVEADQDVDDEPPESGDELG